MSLRDAAGQPGVWPVVISAIVYDADTVERDTVDGSDIYSRIPGTAPLEIGPNAVFRGPHIDFDDGRSAKAINTYSGYSW